MRIKYLKLIKRKCSTPYYRFLYIQSERKPNQHSYHTVNGLLFSSHRHYINSFERHICHTQLLHLSHRKTFICSSHPLYTSIYNIHILGYSDFSNYSEAFLVAPTSYQFRVYGECIRLSPTSYCVNIHLVRVCPVEYTGCTSIKEQTKGVWQEHVCVNNICSHVKSLFWHI